MMLDFLVIIPTGRSTYLSETLHSVSLQNGVTKHVLVVDDTVGGASERIAASFENVQYIRMPVPTGGWPAKVRNYGLQAAINQGLRARVVHFLDDDDICAEGIYATALEAFECNPSIGVVFGQLSPFCVFSDDPIVKSAQEEQLAKVTAYRKRNDSIPWFFHRVGTSIGLEGLSRWLYKFQAVFGYEIFLCSGAFIRFEVCLQITGFDETFRITEDFEYYTRAIRTASACYLDKVSAFYRVGSADSLWCLLDPSESESKRQHDEIQLYMQRRRRRFIREVGSLRYWFLLALHRIVLMRIIKYIATPIKEYFQRSGPSDMATGP